MLCEECGKNNAAVAITVSTGDGISTRHLCHECMKKMELSIIGVDIHGFLSSVLSALGKEKKPEQPGPVCDACGLSYAEFERTGRLGCAECYRAFADRLTPMLRRVHGHTKHAGRTPASTEAPKPEVHEDRAGELRRLMEEAVAEENFEEAARCRDELRALVQQDGEAAQG